MAKDKSIPDSIAPHLSQIAERLWSGRAAVMVGAGFSKNASRDYPTWAQLGDKLYEKAHGKTPDADDKSYISLLKVAEEVESVVGRPALDALLKSDIPDLGAKPSNLHVGLLNLPWVDVLTTNYDTLLERACREVIKHRYSYMVNQSDLPYAQKPRIIKLHGSFPAHLPFIITEEDYRKYPQTHAAFVNTVRQALLENTLCLIGFSGDDPNFLHWIGWVRDQVGGEGTQPIYLISASSFSTAQQLLLAKRNIIVVDMSLCDGVAKNDHKAALTKLFEFLDIKDPSRLDWPRSSHESRNLLWGPTNQKISLIELKDVVEFWRDQRLTYPGWLVLPHENRANLFFYTSRWLSAEMDAEVGELRDGLDIQYFGELVWRIEKCLLPIFDHVAQSCESMLKKYCPFEGDSDADMGASIRCTDKTNNSLEWDAIKSAWLAIAFSLLRYYREKGKDEKWDKLKRRLESRRSHFSDEQSEFFYYQEYLFFLFKLDLSNARTSLRKWKPTSSQPLWKSIRCFAMAELGQFDGGQIQSEIEEALYETRIKYQAGKDANTVVGLSHEAYQMVACRWLEWDLDRWDTVASSMEEELMCARFQEDWSREGNMFVTWKEDWDDLKDKKDWSGEKDWKGDKNVNGRQSKWQELLRSVRSEIRSKKAKSFNQRWDELKSDRCDPWGELKLLLSSGSSYFGQDKDRLNAYSFFRLFEDVGFSFRVRNMIFEQKSVVTNLPHLANDSPYWVRSIFFRLGDNSRVIDQLFNRESICKLKAVECDDLIGTCLGALESFHAALKRGELFGGDCMENRLASVLPDVISRFCCKCSLQIKDRILSFITDVYASAHKNKFFNIHKLVRGFFACLSKPEQYQFLTKILDVDFPRNLGLRDQMNYVSLTQWLTIGDRKSESKPKMDVADITIDGLLLGALNASAEQRQWSVTSLSKLCELNILDASQKQRFSNALWAKVDEIGFPADTDFYKFVFLKLPHPDDIFPKEIFKQYVDGANFPVQASERGYEVTDGDITLVHEIIGASEGDDQLWVKKDALKLLEKVELWWKADKNRLENEKSPSQNRLFGGEQEFHKRLGRIADLIAIAIGPSLNSRLAKKEKTKLFNLLDDMRSQEIRTLEARAACIHVLPELRETLMGLIADALHGNNKIIQIDAHRAIRCIALNRKLVDLWSESYGLLIQFIQWNRSASLAEGMGIARRILNENDGFFPASFKNIIGKRLIQLVEESDYKNGKLDINIGEKINLRRVAVSLAKKIDEVYEHKDDVLNKAIDNWREIGESADEFAEVRNAWVE
ncbi:SIR2 family NAD-dependent protein deacylase [Cellvibrio fontiphilus]|uniref:SIR2 family protein n=1 Tax=Cellvibrio fontiphilus TaxID=1815559 RepID=A0ABV7FIR7_9GAMM